MARKWNSSTREYGLEVSMDTMRRDLIGNDIAVPLLCNLMVWHEAMEVELYANENIFGWLVYQE